MGQGVSKTSKADQGYQLEPPAAKAQLTHEEMRKARMRRFEVRKLERLPLDVFRLIVKRLNIKDRNNLALVSREVSKLERLSTRSIKIGRHIGGCAKAPDGSEYRYLSGYGFLHAESIEDLIEVLRPFNKIEDLELCYLSVGGLWQVFGGHLINNEDFKRLYDELVVGAGDVPRLSLKRLHAHNLKISLEGIELQPSLIELNVEVNENIDSARLQSATKECNKLKCIRLTCTHTLLSDIPLNPDLEELEYGHSYCARFLDGSDLKELNNDALVNIVNSCPKLKKVKLGSAGITLEGVKFSSALTDLELYYNGYITDETLAPAIADCPNLVYLDVRKTGVSAEFKVALQQARPKLKIF